MSDVRADLKNLERRAKLDEVRQRGEEERCYTELKAFAYESE